MNGAGSSAGSEIAAGRRDAQGAGWSLYIIGNAFILILRESVLDICLLSIVCCVEMSPGFCVVKSM